MEVRAFTEDDNVEEGGNAGDDARETLVELGSTDFGTFESEGGKVEEGGDTITS